MKLNWAERWVVNNPSRVIEQRLQISWMQNAMPLSPGATILEVGCGRGAGASLILKEFHPSVLHAMDLDINMIQKANKYLRPSQRNQISMFVADTMNLPYRDASVDAIFGFGVLHHIPDWRSAVYEISRVLKAGGVYYLEELYPSVYQNFITKHILLHPTEDRFHSEDLRKGLAAAHLAVKNTLEVRKVGILGICIRES